MRGFRKIVFPVCITVFICFCLGQDIFGFSPSENLKIENTDSGSGIFRALETEAEEEASILVQHDAARHFHTILKDLSSASSVLPPRIYYSIWQPPDNS